MRIPKGGLEIDDVSVLQSDAIKNKKVVRGFLDAWANCDPAGVQRFAAPDSVLCLSTGPEPGLTLRGSAEISPVLERVLSDAKGTVLSEIDLYALAGGVAGNWTCTGVNAKGETVDVRGCGIFEVYDGKVTRLDAYRKATG
ncbi:nuclear transport factor 2 family protein [Rhizobium esperanzae]